MKNSIVIEGKAYISSSRASEISKYSKDYIGQLCRGKKIEARMIGRSWYVLEESIIAHKKLADELQEKRYQEYASRPAVYPGAAASLAPIAEAPSQADRSVAQPIQSVRPPEAPAPIVWDHLKAEIEAARGEAGRSVEPGSQMAASGVPPIKWTFRYDLDAEPLLPALDKEAHASIPALAPVLTMAPVPAQLTTPVTEPELARASSLGSVRSPLSAELRSIMSYSLVLATIGVVAAVSALVQDPSAALRAMQLGAGETASAIGESIAAIAHGTGELAASSLSGIGIASAPAGGSAAQSQTGQGYIDFPYYTGPAFSSTATSSGSASGTVSALRTSARLADTSSYSDLASRVSYLESMVASLGTLASAIQAPAYYTYGPYVPVSATPLTAIIGANVTNGVSSPTQSGGVLSGGTSLHEAPKYGQLLVGDSTGNYSLEATSSLGLVNHEAIASLDAGFLPLWSGSLFGNSLLYESTTTGSIGIGTTSPSATFAVAGTTYLGGDVFVGGNLNATGTVSFGATLLTASSTGVNGTLTVASSTALGSTLSIASSTSIGGTLAVTGSTTLANTLSVASSTAIGGNVSVAGATSLGATTTVAGAFGIGTSTPFTALSVVGGTYLGGNAYIGGNIVATGTISLPGTASFGTTTAANLIVTNTSTSTFGGPITSGGPGAFVLATADQSSPLLLNPYGGRVGVGTTSPSAEFAVQGSAVISDSLTVGGLTVSGNSIVLGDSTSNTIAINSGIASNLVPTQNATYNLGSPGYFWNDAYIENLNVNNISAASTTIGGTSNDTFTLNSDNASIDGESESFIFYRGGSVVPNALFTWNAAQDAKRFELNQPLYIHNGSASTTNPTLTLQGVAGQTGNILQIASSSGSTLFAIGPDGSFTSASLTATGSSTLKDLLALGSTTLQNLTFVNATGTAATTTSFYAQTASSTNLYATSLAAGNASLGVLNAGGIAIGTNSAPLGKLQVEGGTIYANAPESDTVVNGGAGTAWQTYANLVGSAGLWAIRTGTNGSINFDTNNSFSPINALAILTGGNVGIGNSAPTYRLDVAGAGHFTSYIDAANFVATSSSIASQFQQVLALGSTTLQNFTAQNSTSTNATTTTSFATTASSTNLYAQTAAFGSANIAGAASFGATTLSSLTVSNLTSGRVPFVTTAGLLADSGSFLWNNAANLLTVTGNATTTELTTTGSTYLATAGGSGSVGIGTTTPSATLTIATSSPANTNVEALRLVDSNTSSSGAYMFIQQSNDATRGLIIGQQYNAPNFANPYIRTAGSNSNEIEIHTASTTSGQSIGRLFLVSSNLTATGNGQGSGQLGIGSTSPWANLSVAGTAGGGNPIFAVSKSTAAFATSTAFIIDGTGLVGIGTTSPYTALAVNGTTTALAFTATSTTLASTFPLASTTLLTVSNQAYIQNLLALGSTTLQNFTGLNATTTNATTTSSFATTASSTNLFAQTATFGTANLASLGGAAYSSLTSNFLPKWNGGTFVNSLIYDSGTNIGIGTTSPFARLDILSTLNNQTPLLNIASSTNGAATSTALFVAANGNVGVGTANPQALLDLGATYNSSSYTFRTGSFALQPFALNDGFISDNSYYNGSSFTRIGTGYASGFQFYNGQVLFNQANTGTGNFTPTVAMKSDFSNGGSVALGGNINVNPGNYSGASAVVLGSGNVGIGLINPSALLHLSSTTATTLFKVDGTANVLTALGTGNVGIGTTSPYTALAVNGTTTALAFTATSTTLASTFPLASTTLLTVSNQAYIQNLLALGSTTLQNFTGLNATTTSATTTTSFATTASSTNLFAQTATFGTTNFASLGGAAYSSLTSNFLPKWNGGTFVNSLIYDSGTNVGIGTTSPYTALAVNGTTTALAFTATSTTATSTFAGGVNINNGALVTDFSGGYTAIQNLYAGAMSFPSDAGTLTWMDMPVTSASAIGVVDSYSADLNGNPLLTLFGVSDGAGNLATTSVGIGTTSPWGFFSINPNANSQGPEFVVGSSTKTDLIVTNGGNVGIGNSAPTYKLDVTGAGHFTSYVDAANFVATSTSGVSTFAGLVGIGTTSPFAALDILSQRNNQTPLLNIASSTNGAATSTALFVAANGNVGIGTANPQALLHVTGSVATAFRFDSGTAGVKWLSFQDQSNNELLGFTRNINGATISTWSGGTSNLTLAPGNAGSTVIVKGASSQTADIFQVTNNTPSVLLNVAASGSVGIGTSTPQWLLNPYSASASQLALSAGAGVAQWAFRNAGGNLYVATTTVSGTATTSTVTFAIIGSNGNVGIGTSTPGVTLDLYNSSPAAGQGAIRFANGDGYGGIIAADNSALTFGGPTGGIVFVMNDNKIRMQPGKNIETNTGSIGFDGNGGGLSFNSSNTANFSVGATTTQITSTGSAYFATASGNVGVGTTTPWARLAVNGAAGGATPVFVVATSTAAFATSTALIVDQNGLVGINKAAPAQALDVNGTVRQSGAVSCTLTSNASGDIICTSDANLKQNMTPYVAGLSVIDGIAPSYFQYKGEDHTRVGFIAQNVQTVLPEATPLQTNGYLGLDSNAILAATVNAVKELHGSVNGLATDASSTSLTVSSTTQAFSAAQTTIFDLVGITQDQGDRIADALNRIGILEGEVSALATSTQTMAAQIASLQSRLDQLASGQYAGVPNAGTSTTATAAELASSTPFIQAVAGAVQNAIAVAGEWTVGKLTATVVYADRVEAKTVAVSQGFDITDQATGAVWCVTIKNGSWSKVPWSCETPAGATAAAADAIGQTEPIGQSSSVNIIQQNQPAPQATTTDAVIATTTPAVDGSQSAAATTTDAVATSTQSTGDADQGAAAATSTASTDQVAASTSDQSATSTATTTTP